MSHPFKDKLVLFIGNPKRCSRQEARDALEAVGGIPDVKVTYFLNYAVAFAGAENTVLFQKAQKYAVPILSEDDFLNILDGKALPPQKTIKSQIIYGTDQEASEKQQQMEQEILDRRRMKSAAKYGVLTPDGSRLRITPKSDVMEYAESIDDILRELDDD